MIASYNDYSLTLLVLTTLDTENLIVVHLDQKFHVLFRNRMFINLFVTLRTGPSPDPDESRPHFQIPFLLHFNIMFPYTSHLPSDLSLCVFRLNDSTQFSSLPCIYMFFRLILLHFNQVRSFVLLHYFVKMLFCCNRSLKR